MSPPPLFLPFIAELSKEEIDKKNAIKINLHSSYHKAFEYATLSQLLEVQKYYSTKVIALQRERAAMKATGRPCEKISGSCSVSDPTERTGR